MSESIKPQKPIISATKQPGLADIVNEIQSQQEKIAAEEQTLGPNEAAVVRRYFNIAAKMTLLKAATKKHHGQWQDQVKLVGFHPRVARRYLKIGACTWKNSGLTEPTLKLLPRDLEKLDWISRLSQIQLDQVLAEHDLKRLDRIEVVKLVKKLIGAKLRKPVDPGKRLRKAAEKFFAKAAGGLEEWLEAGPGTEEQQSYLNLLDTGCADLRKTLAQNTTEAPEYDQDD